MTRLRVMIEAGVLASVVTRRIIVICGGFPDSTFRGGYISILLGVMVIENC